MMVHETVRDKQSVSVSCRMNPHEKPIAIQALPVLVRDNEIVLGVATNIKIRRKQNYYEGRRHVGLSVRGTGNLTLTPSRPCRSAQSMRVSVVRDSFSAISRSLTQTPARRRSRSVGLGLIQ